MELLPPLTKLSVSEHCASQLLSQLTAIGIPERLGWLGLVAALLGIMFSVGRGIRATSSRREQTLLKIADDAQAEAARASVKLQVTNQRLAESNIFLTSVINAKAAHIVILDRDGNVLQTNQAWKRFWHENAGTSERLRDQNYLQVCDQASGECNEDAAKVAQAIRNVLQGRSSHETLTYACHSPQEQRWFSVTISPLESRQSGVVIVHYDVTEQVSAMERLKQVNEENARLALVTQRTTNAVIITDADRQITWVNAGFERITGYTLEEVKGKSPGTLLQFEGTCPATRATMRTALLAGKPFKGEILNRSKHGREYWLDLDIQPIYDKAGTLEGFMAIESEITQLIETSQRAEKSLREVNALRTALEEHCLLSVADKAGNIIDVNTAFCEVSGYTRDELIGQNHRILNSGFHADSFWHNVWGRISKGKPWRGEVCNKRKNGEVFWVDSTIVPWFNEMGEIEKYVSIRLDITSAKQAAMKVLELNHQLRDSVKNARALARSAESANRAKSEFLANMSHEIRTPMTAILGFNEQIATTAQSTEVAAATSTIQRNGEHLLKLLNDILDLSRIESGKLELEQLPILMPEFLQDIEQTMRVRAEENNLDWRVSWHPSLPLVIKSDTTRIRQIMINLVGNAIKFTESGSVSLHVSVNALEPNALEPKNCELCFQVVDTGIGISDAQRMNLFQPFEQADSSMSRRFGGSGLGLAISNRLCDLLGGTITCTSQLGVGSTFELRLRVATVDSLSHAAATAASSANSTANHRTGKAAAHTPSDKLPPSPTALAGDRILLVEDGPDNRRLICFILKKSGALVSTAENGKVGMEMALQASSQGQPFDVILMDMQMPMMDGYTATANLRKQQYRHPIIALTAHAMADDRAKCLQAGCDDYLSKPINRSHLISLISRYLARNDHHPQSRAIATATL